VSLADRSAMAAWEVAARVAVDDLMARYVRCADSGRSEDLAALFTEDGVLRTDADEVRGRAAIATYLEAQKTSLAGGGGPIRHHVSSVRVDLDGERHGRAVSYFLALTGTGLDHWGTYRDRLERTGGGWRFAERTAHVDGAAPGSWAEGRRRDGPPAPPS
jgi:uncharacterized protein (TIGR02246 family)